MLIRHGRLVPAIDVFGSAGKKDVAARDKLGHDEF